MKRFLLLLVTVGTVSLLSGCTVIDFLDGKHFSHETDYNRPQYDSGSFGGGHSGGHSH
ncbi:hypothetical protein [Geobacter grbiciae]|uniref:hypothetical protein n=1 Tax=Geobacter grbiciae TaxID=155042 RepID=UPI001C037210|nr:hypothetical protein [Geobacter grbiciae]MBT1074243.1 hypothetical protein [Geobacter grbiciae]